MEATMELVTAERDGMRVVMDMGTLDVMTRRETAFATFAAMLEAAGNFRPTLADTLLADAYDAAQAARGDGRRAFRRHAATFR